MRPTRTKTPSTRSSGFGKPPEFTAFAAAPGMFTFGWGPVLHQLAAGLGVKDRQHGGERRTGRRRGVVRHAHRAHRGGNGRERCAPRLTGYVDGKPTFVIDHVTRMRDDIAPDWPQPHISIPPRDFGYGAASGRGLYRVEIEGSPTMRCEFEMADDHDHDLGARMAGASRMVNVIPAVCQAQPGLLSALDLPLVTGVGLVRPVPGPSPTAGCSEMCVDRHRSRQEILWHNWPLDSGENSKPFGQAEFREQTRCRGRPPHGTRRRACMSSTWSWNGRGGSPSRIYIARRAARWRSTGSAACRRGLRRDTAGGSA